MKQCGLCHDAPAMPGVQFSVVLTLHKDPKPLVMGTPLGLCSRCKGRPSITASPVVSKTKGGVRKPSKPKTKPEPSNPNDMGLFEAALNHKGSEYIKKAKSKTKPKSEGAAAVDRKPVIKGKGKGKAKRAEP